jgi:hypothetical protein
MAMSDCSKCWETPCMCGHEYKIHSDSYISELILAILSTRTKISRKKIIEELWAKK